MKGGGILLVIVAAAVAFMLLGGFDTLGGLGGENVDPDAIPRPDVPDVDVNDAAKRAEDGANSAADEVSSWTPATWKIIVLAVTATVAAVLWFRSPKFRWATIGIGAALLAVVAFA